MALGGMLRVNIDIMQCHTQNPILIFHGISRIGAQIHNDLRYIIGIVGTAKQADFLNGPIDGRINLTERNVNKISGDLEHQTMFSMM